MKAILKFWLVLIAVAVATDLKASARQLEICPKWVVQVLDDQGNPLTNCTVYEAWQFYGLSGEQHEEKKVDSTGRVSFPPRSISVSEARYVASRAASSLNVHSSFGPSAHLEISADGFKRTLIYYDDHKLWLSDSGAEGAATKKEIKIKVSLRPIDLIDAVKRRDLATVKQFVLRSPASVKIRDSIGFTPLHWAAGRQPKDLEITIFLIESGADVNAGAKNGMTPVHRAAKNGSIKLMSVLISKGGDVNAVMHNPNITEDLYTALHEAVQNSWGDEIQIQMIDLLVKQGADINAKAHFNETPLFIAAYLDGPSVVKELLTKGADPNIRNTDGKTALDMAREFKKSENIRVLENFSLKPK